MNMQDKILKCLMLTTSQNDAEALNAIRMANKLLKAEKLTWDEFFKIVQKPAALTPQHYQGPVGPHHYQPQQYQAAQQSAAAQQGFYNIFSSPLGSQGPNDLFTVFEGPLGPFRF